MERGPSEKGRVSILGLILFGSLDPIIGRSLTCFAKISPSNPVEKN
jgi:hypothetical protein